MEVSILCSSQSVICIFSMTDTGRPVGRAVSESCFARGRPTNPARILVGGSADWYQYPADLTVQHGEMMYLPRWSVMAFLCRGGAAARHHGPCLRRPDQSRRR
jgi:hypothetical protein